MNAKFVFRNIEPTDQALLFDLLYIALWDAPDEERRPRSILEKPRVQRLIECWGRDEDFGLLAIDRFSGKELGGIWARLDGYDNLKGFGCDYPVLGIAVFEEYQGVGVGSFMMASFLEGLKGLVEGVRLGVNPRNQRAIGLYKKFGFQEYAVGEGGYPQMSLRF